MSAAGSRSVRKTVAAPPRRESWATWPSTHTSPSRPIHSATLRATVRTGHGASGDDGAVMPPSIPAGSDVPAAASGVGGHALQAVAQHPHVRLPRLGGLLV